MGTMRYKPLDKVRIKSLDWYNENKDEYGTIIFSTESGDYSFTKEDVRFCGRVVTIAYEGEGHYLIAEDDRMYFWIDEMIEGLVEEETKPNIIEEAKTYWDSIKDAWICPEGYQFVDENGNVINATKIVLEKKKKEYPKTYEECCDVLDIDILDSHVEGYKYPLVTQFQALLIARDAYWKIAGEDMGLGKPWEPDWTIESSKYIILFKETKIEKHVTCKYSRILAFPTEEMRDAFYENFKEEIEFVKELL